MITAAPGDPPPRIWGEVIGRVTIDAMRTGLPIQDRSLLIRVHNAFFDVDLCRLPNRLIFNVPNRIGDTSWLYGYTVWCNFTYMTVHFSTSDSIAVGDDIDIGIWLHRAMLYNQSMYVTFPVKAPEVDSAVETAATAAATTTVVLSVAGGGSGATEIQGLGVLGMMGCAEPEMKAAMRSARKAITPWQLGDDEIGFLAGNLTIVASVWAALGLATAVLYAKFSYDKKQGKEYEEDEFPDPTLEQNEKEPLGRALTITRLPGMGFTVAVLAQQGITLESFMILHNPEAAVTSKVFAVFGALYSAALPVLAMYFLVKRFRGKFANFRYVSHGVPLPIRIIMPSQFWLPVVYSASFGTFFKTLRQADLYYAAVDPLAKILLVSFVAGFNTRPGAGCSAQYGTLSAIYVAEAIYRVIRWPHLSPIENIGPLAAALTTALVSSSQGFGFEVLSVQAAMLVQSYLSMGTAVLKVAISLINEMVWQKKEIRARYERNDFDWGSHDMAIDEKGEKLLDGKGVASDSDAADSDGSDGGAASGKDKSKGGSATRSGRGKRSNNPLLEVPERATKAPPPSVPDTSGTLAALLAMKAESNAAVGRGGKQAAKKKKGSAPPKRRGRRPAGDTSSESSTDDDSDEDTTSDDSDL